jgi:hypothetical protein
VLVESGDSITALQNGLLVLGGRERATLRRASRLGLRYATPAQDGGQAEDGQRSVCASLDRSFIPRGVKNASGSGSSKRGLDEGLACPESVYHLLDHMHMLGLFVLERLQQFLNEIHGALQGKLCIEITRL